MYLAVLFFLLSFSASTAAADDAAAVFARHRAAILVAGVHSFDGYVFATVPQPLGRSGASRVRAKAELEALRCFIQEAVGDPARCVENEALRTQFANAAQSVVSTRFQAHGIETVHQDQVGEAWILVKSLPQERLAGLELSCEELLRSLYASASAPDAPLALLAMMLELAPVGRLEELENAVRAALAREYSALHAAALGSSWNRVPDGYRFGSRAPRAEGVSATLTRANARPGDAQAVTDARGALKTARYLRAAELIATPKRSVEQLSPERAAPLREELERIRADHSAIAPAIAWLEALALLGGAPEMCRGSGAAADAALMAFQHSPPQFAGCIAASLAEDAATADNWNLTAVSLRELGALRLSVEACRVVLASQPDHRYAAVNELLAWKELGDRTQVERGLAQLDARGSLNAWALGKTEILRAWLVEAAQPPSKPTVPPPPSEQK